MQDKLYIMSGSGIQEVDVLQQDNSDYYVNYLGNSMSISKQTMMGWITGNRKWMTSPVPPNSNQILIQSLEKLLALAKEKSGSESGTTDNAVVYERLKEAGLV